MNLDLLDIRKTALVVVDMQNAFCHKEGTLGISGVDTDHLSSIVVPLRDLVKRCQAVDMPVLWTLQEHFPIDHRRARKRLPSHTSRRKRVSALVGTWDAEIIDELKEFANDPTFVIRKHRYGAFHETRMHIVLEMLGVDALLMTGLTTNACVETTIREAYLRDYDVVGVTDCISGVNPQVGVGGVGGLASVFCRDVFVGRRVWLGSTGNWRPRRLALHHVLLKVRDFERSKRFYFDLLGFSERPGAKPLADGRPFVSTRQGLGITVRGSGDQGQVDHFAFAVRNVEALSRQLKEAGVVFDRELGEGPYGQAIYIRDPDGNILELFEPATSGT